MDISGGDAMSWIRVRPPIRPVSAKRRREQKLRRAVVAEVRLRDGGCRARGVLEHECSGPLDVHELVRRSQWRGGYLVADNAVTLCRTAHDYVTLHPHEAVELGLAKWSWQR